MLVRHDEAFRSHPIMNESRLRPGGGNEAIYGIVVVSFISLTAFSLIQFTDAPCIARGIAVVSATIPIGDLLRLDGPLILWLCLVGRAFFFLGCGVSRADAPSACGITVYLVS